MTTGSDFADAVESVRHCINCIGDEVQEEYVTDSSGGEIVVGYQATHGSYVYNVVGEPGRHYFNVEFPFSIPHDLGSLLTEETALEIVDDGDLDGDTDVTTLAAYEILEQMSQENREKFRYELTTVLSSTDTAFTLRATDSGAITGFDISRRVFPYDEDFSLTEFNHSVQTVINSGNSAVQFVATAFDFEDLVESQTTGDQTVDGPRYLQ